VFWAISLGLTLLFVATRMLCVGLSVDVGEIEALFRDRAVVARTLVANVVVVPVLGVAIAAMLPVTTTGGVLGGSSPQRRVWLARVTTMRNARLSLLVAMVSFPDSGVAVAVLLFVVVEVSVRLLGTLIGPTIVPSMLQSSRRERKP
jgi:predicted Na+-dependent transporter